MHIHESYMTNRQSNRKKRREKENVCGTEHTHMHMHTRKIFCRYISMDTRQYGLLPLYCVIKHVYIWNGEGKKNTRKFQMCVEVVSDGGGGDGCAGGRLKQTHFFSLHSLSISIFLIHDKFHFPQIIFFLLFYFLLVMWR